MTKVWDERQMVGTFKLKLIEPEPMKRVYKHTHNSAQGSNVCSITLTSSKLVTIYWGDGTATKGVSGTDKTVTHTYKAQGVYYVSIVGNIDEISKITTKAVQIWSKL